MVPPSQARGSFQRITRNEVEALRLLELLNPDQRRVLAGLVQGSSRRSIAQTMQATELQIEAMRVEILRMFGVGTTADLIRIGIYAGLHETE